MASLVDTNVLVYFFDPRDAAKQRIAEALLRERLVAEALVIPHQAIVEFIAAVTRPRADLGGAPLLPIEQARLQAEALMGQFPVIYPTAEVLVTALRGSAAYQLSWFDAHIWAYAEVYGLAEIVSEDFEHGRHYGNVRAVNPFLQSAEVRELPPLYHERASRYPQPHSLQRRAR